MSNWIKQETKFEAFQYGEEPEMLYIIKSGFPNQYLVIREDAFETYPNINDQIYYTKEEIKNKYNIIILF